MTFRVPGSSSPPSTPDPPRGSRLASHPSTTPAGPPPSSLIGFSTTPAGNPPTSSFFATGSNGSTVPFPSIESINQNPLNSSPLKEQHILSQRHDEDEEDLDAMDEDEAPGHLMTYSQASKDDLAPSGEPLNLQEIAKGLVPSTPENIVEPDDLVLRTEHVLDSMSRTVDEDSSKQEECLSAATKALLEIWKETYPPNSTDGDRVGPSLQKPPLQKALFLASLLLQLHHPPESHPSSRSQSLSRRRTDPIPKVLLDWLGDNHWPYQGDLNEALNFEPNAASHERFWDIVYNTVLRGNLRGACELLQSADLRHAATAVEDGASTYGYQGKHLSNGRRVIQRAIEVLESCPALRSGDWNVKGAEWTLFRKRIHQAVSDLQNFAEGNNADRYTGTETHFEASHFGMTTSSLKNLSVTQRSRQAESKVPWTIYQNLVYLYEQMLGTSTEIIAASGDWVEATIGIVVWWSGDDEEDPPRESINRSRHLSRSMNSERLVDIHPQLAYLRKLSTTIEDLQTSPENAEDSELQIDPTDAVQVGLGCVMIGELEGLVRIIKGWSPVIATAIVEIADMGHWLGQAKTSEDILDGFDQSDLMVLSYAQQRGAATDHDTVLCDYANLLASKSEFLRGGSKKHGWQVAVEVLGRLHDPNLAAKKIGESLDRLQITDSSQVDQTVSLCNRMGLYDHARRISERYGDHLAETSHSYGSAIYHYVRAGSSRKIKDLLDLLVSLSLVQSLAYPPEDELDEAMRSLVSTPKQTLAKLAVIDPAMRDTLLHYIAGYATIRKLYSFRDHNPSGKSPTTTLHPLARRKEALSSIISLLQSASDPIHGGLFDSTIDSAVPVDTLLVLLAETLPFVNHPKSLLSHAQTLAILKAVEDVSTVSATIYERAEETLRSALASFHGSAPPSPRTTLKKSNSNMTGSGFSLVGSELLRMSHGEDNLSGSGSGSGVLVKGPVKRGWDWRKGLEREATGETVLQLLRVGLAKELGRTWLAQGAG